MRKCQTSIPPQIRHVLIPGTLAIASEWPRIRKLSRALMRNIMICLGLEMKESILQKTSRLLSPDGYLLLGVSETTTILDDSFEPVSVDGASYFRFKKKVA
jgi:chemotaxis methyl-accepting protein methylase